MKSIKNPFSLPFYRDTLQRLRIFGIVCAVVFGALAAVDSLGYLFTQVSSDFLGVALGNVKRLSLGDINGNIATFITVVVPIMTVCAFGFLMKRHTADFYGTLPISSLSMAVSGMLAVLTVSVFVIAVSSIVSVLALIPCMGKTVEYAALRGIAELFGLMVASALAVATSALAAAVCGTVANGIITSLIIIFAPRAVMGLFNLSLEFLNPTLVSGHIIPFFDEKYNMLSALFYGDSVLITPISFVYTALITVAIAALATFVLTKRRSESATHPFAFPSARHTVRIMLATVVVMLGVMIVSIDNILLVVGSVLFVLAVGTYFIYELITGRRGGNFVASLITFPIFIAVNGLIILALVISNSAFAAYSPSASEIKSVSVVYEPDSYSYMDYADYVNLRSHNLVLSDDSSRSAVADALDREDSESDGESYVSRVFKIKTSRGVAYRRLSVKTEEFYGMMMSLAVQPEYEALWLDVAGGATEPMVSLNGLDISEEGAWRILRAMETEVERIGFESWYTLYLNSDDIYTYVYYTIEYEGESYTVSLPIYYGMTDTVAVCETERRAAAGAAVVQMRGMVLDAISGNGDTVWLNVSAMTDDGSYYAGIEMSPDNPSAAEAFNALIQMVSYESIGADDPSLSIYCYGEGLFSDYVYLELAIDSRVDSEALKAFFLKYEGDY